MQRSAENLTYGSRTLQTTKGDGNIDCAVYGLFLPCPFGIPAEALLCLFAVVLEQMLGDAEKPVVKNVDHRR